MIRREKYINEIKEFYDSDLVKVITGIRRSGKSVILEEIRDEIALTSDNIIYLNFEKKVDLDKCASATELLNYVQANRKEDSKCYIFLDEIQEVENWRIAVRDLRLGNNSVFITGSNSKILSEDFRSLLSGRYIRLLVRPLVYKEIVELCKENEKEASIADYLIWGGFPLRFSFSSVNATKMYIEELMNTIVLNDIIMRYKIKKVLPFRKMVNFICRNNSRIFSARNVYNILNKEGEKISLNSIVKYLGYLKEAYIISEVPQYSSKAKKELDYYEKLYLTDVSFSSILVENGRFDIDHNLESIVYNELIYRGYSVKLFKNNDKEIDFHASKNGKAYYIQVAYSVVDENAYKREFSAFNGLPQDAMKILITNDDIDYSTSLVKHIKLKDFLLSIDL